VVSAAPQRQVRTAAGGRSAGHPRRTRRDRHVVRRADYAHDIRLACHGLDKDDNDFIVGLLGKDLFPLSAIVQAMRKTQQTSLYLERLGPFFVGRAIWQASM
jgi:chlorite dismutase